jgi:hypothetical protein
MALVQSYLTKWGFELPTAYFRVTEVEMYYEDQKGNMAVSVYMDQEAREDGREPVEVKGYNIDNVEKEPVIQSSYSIELGEIPKGMNKTLNFDLNGDTKQVVELTEGNEFHAIEDDEHATYENIVEALNSDILFSDGWSAVNEYPTIKVMPKVEGPFDGSGGNNLIINGLIEYKFEQVIEGVDAVPGDFYTFFSNSTEENIRRSSYKYLKTLSEYKDAVDIPQDTKEEVL